MCVSVCVLCVCVRERERVCVCVCVYLYVLSSLTGTEGLVQFHTASGHLDLELPQSRVQD